MHYRIIRVSAVFSEKRAIEQLTKEVNDAIALGWEPVGGVCHAGSALLQAMVRRR